MFISRKRYEAELKKAREEGREDAMKQHWEEERIREIHKRIGRLWEKIDQPKAVPGFSDGVSARA